MNTQNPLRWSRFYAGVVMLRQEAQASGHSLPRRGKRIQHMIDVSGRRLGSRLEYVVTCERCGQSIYLIENGSPTGDGTFTRTVPHCEEDVNFYYGCGI